MSFQFLNPNFEFGRPNSSTTKPVSVSSQGSTILNAYNAFRNTQQPVNRSSSISVTTAKSTESASVVPSTTKTSSKKTYTPTKVVQQRLSDQFGVVTFDEKGNISTVPTTRALNLDPKYFTGVGMFTGETASTFQAKLTDLINQVKIVGGTIGNTIFTAPSVGPGSTSGGSTPAGTGENAPGNPASGVSNNSQTPSTVAVTNTDKVIDSLEQFKNFVGPIGLAVGIGLLILVILKR